MFSSDKWFGSTSAKFYNGVITSSGKFDRTASTYLSLDKSSDGNKRTMTFSWWMKVCSLDSTGDPRGVIYTSGYSGSGSSQSGADIVFSNQRIQVLEAQNNAGLWNIYFSYHFSDPSNWYHCVVVIDTTESTNSDRVKLFVNGVQQTDTDSASWPSSSLQTRFNNNLERIGTGDASGSNYNHTNLYIADFHLIDGTALTPSSFGETKNGVFIPKDTSGLTFGSKGWRLQFKETGTGTASSSTIGADTGGNNLHFTSHNMGADNSAIPDCPENNFPTINSLNTNSNLNLSEGSLKIIPANTSNYYRAMSTMAVPKTGKWYWEVRLFVASYVYIFGLYDVESPTNQRARTVSADVTASTNDYQVRTSSSLGIDISTEGSAFSDWLSTNIALGDIVSFAYDADNNKMWFALNGTFQNTSGTANPATGDDPRFSSMASTEYYIGANMPNPASGGAMFNFGADDTFAGAISSSGNTDANGAKFKYTPPTGFVGLNSNSLPDTTISPNQDTQADDHFNTVLYSGDGSSSRNITGVGFQPDWVWIAQRNNSSAKVMYDSNRGVNKMLRSDSTAAEDDSSIYGYLSAFGSDGFTLTAGTTNNNYTNENGKNIVAWNWKANGGTTSSNSDGTITSTVQANTTAGFSIVTYTGSASGTVGHGLSQAPDIIIVKSRTVTNPWVVYTSITGKDNYLILNTTAGSASTSNYWGTSGVTSSVFGIYSNSAYANVNGDLVAYCFHNVEGYSKVGTYTGNSSTDGTFVHLGFRPSFILGKSESSSGDNWFIFDNKRDVDNVVGSDLNPDSSAAEATSTYMDFLSNGFKLRSTSGLVNDGTTFFYLAFAKQPFKFSNAR